MDLIQWNHLREMVLLRERMRRLFDDSLFASDRRYKTLVRAFCHLNAPKA